MADKSILYVGNFVLPDKSASANRVISNGKIFNSLGYNTFFLGTSYDESFDGIKNIEGFSNLFEQAHPTTTKEWLLHTFSVKKINKLIELLNGVNTIILYNMPFASLLVAKFFFKKKGIDVYYDCTEWTSYTDGSFLKRIFKFTDEFFIRKFLHLVADKLIVISSTMQKAYGKSKKIINLPPLVDINEDIWYQKNENKRDYFEFCFAGTPDGKKERLDYVLDSFLNIDVDNCKLRIVGITKDEFINLYPDFPVNEHFNKNIIFTGKVSHKEAIYYTLNCDCYLFLRQSDRRNNAGFPTKFSESYTCGVPIITTDVSDIGLYMTENNGVLLKNLSVECVKQALIYQLNKGKPDLPLELKKTFHYENYIDIVKNFLK